MSKRAIVMQLAAAGLTLFLAGTVLHAAERRPFRPFLHTLFTDHMVFPRDVEAPVWGWTEPGGKVTATMLNKTAEATAGADGKWLLKLGPFPAGGPSKMMVTGPQTTVTLDDVLVGDVWLCSGQSNMTMGITAVNFAQEEIAKATHPRLRLFDQPPFLREGWSCKWSLCTPEEIVDQGFAIEKLPNGTMKRHGFSATAYFFGRDLQKEIGIPVGLVQTSAPGTFIEMWSSLEVLKPFVQQEDQALAAWFRKNDPAAKDWAAPAFDDSAWKTIVFPHAKEQPAPKFSGLLWFRKSFDLPAELEGKEFALGFGWMGGLPSVWLNGTFLGNLNPDGACTIPAKLLKQGRNTMAVRVLNINGHFGFCTAKPEEMKLEETNGKGIIPLAGDWRWQAGRLKDEFASPPPPVLIRHGDAASGGGGLFKDMIRPLSPFAFKGVVWYQGEANKAGAKVYDKLLTALMADWRDRFPNNGKLPFLIVQLPNFVGHNRPDGLEIPLLREAQATVARTVPDVAMAVAADIGEEQNEHPKNKQEIGRRLALKALETVYGRKIDSSGPVFKSMEPAGDALRLSFDHVGVGLVAKDGELKGFYLAGTDGKFVPAKAVIEGAAVVVSATEIPKPAAVRYGWANWSACDLYNKADLPAAPFHAELPAAAR